MNEMNDIESLKFVLYLAGSVITLLLAVVAYFLNKQIKVQEMLATAVNQLTTAVSVLESQNKDRHPVIEKRLNAHARRLDDNDRDIAVIKNQLKIA